MGIDRASVFLSILESEGYSEIPYRLKYRGVIEPFYTGGVGHRMSNDDHINYKDAEDKRLFWINLYQKDLEIAETGVYQLLTTHNIKLVDPIYHVLMHMVFQMGLAGVSNFVDFLTALSENDIESAIEEMKDSKWYMEQTPDRVDKLIRVLENG